MEFLQTSPCHGPSPRLATFTIKKTNAVTSSVANTATCRHPLVKKLGDTQHFPCRNSDLLGLTKGATKKAQVHKNHQTYVLKIVKIPQGPFWWKEAQLFLNFWTSLQWWFPNSDWSVKPPQVDHGGYLVRLCSTVPCWGICLHHKGIAIPGLLSKSKIVPMIYRTPQLFFPVKIGYSIRSSLLFHTFGHKLGVESIPLRQTSYTL